MITPPIANYNLKPFSYPMGSFPSAAMQRYNHPQPQTRPVYPSYYPTYPLYQTPQPSIQWVPVLRQGPLPRSLPLPLTTSEVSNPFMQPLDSSGVEIFNPTPQNLPTLSEPQSLPVNSFDSQTVIETPLQDAVEPKIELTSPKFTEVKASHILFKVDDSSESDVIFQRISSLREDIIAGKHSFADAAKEFSEGPSGKNGGDLGYFEKGMMVKPFETVAFDSEVSIGSISEPVLTDFGWHLLQIQDRR